MALLPLFFRHRCRFSNSSFTAAICTRRSHLNVSFDITLIHHSNESVFLIFILDSPTFPHWCSFSFPFEIPYNTFSFLLCQVHVDHCVRLHRQAPSGQLLAIAIFFIQSIDCLDCQVLPFLVQSFMVSWSFTSRLWITAYSNTSLEAQFPFFAFSIFPYSAILRCCVLWIFPATFQFSILHCGRLRIAFLHFLWISAIQSIRILFQFQFWQIHLDPICPAPIGHSLPTWTWSHFGQTILFCWHSIWRLIGQLTMQGPGFGLDNHPNPLPPPAIPPPRTPPCPPGLSRLGNSRVEQVTAKAWRWCNKTTETFFKLLLLPAHWGDLLCSTTPAVTIPQWLETGGSARASCQHLFRSVSSMDFQLHYLSCQVVDNFRWIHSQLQKITDGCYEVTHRLAQVEILVFNLDALLEGIQEQLRWMPQKGVLPKSQPKAKAQRPRPSSVLPQQRNTFKRRVQKSFLKKVRTHESRLQSVESSSVNIEKTLRRNKQLSKKVQELEDQLEKQSTRLARLMKAARNTERCLRENGLLRDDQRLSQSSESELEWVKKNDIAAFTLHDQSFHINFCQF